MEQTSDSSRAEAVEGRQDGLRLVTTLGIGPEKVGP